MQDIARLCQMVENQNIQHDQNNAISIQVWITKIQENGGLAILKDRLDPPPPRSGLSQDVFVLCVQTKFQEKQFQKLGSDFMSIDATHNTTEYTGVNVAIVSLRYELEKYKKLIQAYDCRTTLLMQRQVMHACESYWSDPRLLSFIQG